MPLLCDDHSSKPQGLIYKESIDAAPPSRKPPERKQSQHSFIAKTAILSSCVNTNFEASHSSDTTNKKNSMAPPKVSDDKLSAPQQTSKSTNGEALTDTPSTTAPNSPRIPPLRQDSGISTPSRSRPTTLDIPGLTKSKVSPDGRIAQRDVGSKLVIVMVGLPARGKSYITKKVARYLNWLQHDTKIFNVGERRRVAATGSSRATTPAKVPNGKPMNGVGGSSINIASLNGVLNGQDLRNPPISDTKVLINGELAPSYSQFESLPSSAADTSRSSNGYSHEIDPVGHSQCFFSETTTLSDMPINSNPDELLGAESLEQSANFFDPNNAKAAQIREQLAMSTLDELLDYILEDGGSVGIFDATNSTLERRKLIMKKVRERAGPELGVLFLESLCVDKNLLESNMRLKLSGPDYRDQDPVVALADFKKRVTLYEKKYTPLGDYEERNDMPYIQMIDVGRKVVSHQIRGFLSAQTVYYLLNFNLSARQIWITRHGESIDNVNGKIGGDSDLSSVGRQYGQALTRFMKHERKAWDFHQEAKAMSTHFPPHPGDTTPPNPEYSSHSNKISSDQTKSFCVWTSMLKRSIQTAEYFDEEDFDIKQMKMLDELNAGSMEGMTYDEIRTQNNAEYELRKRDKLHYRYPGAGGEGYLDIINRLRAVIVEVERMTDHVLLVGHRSVARVLLAYFKGLKREDVADLDVPLGMLYMLEPKPYGVEFKAYRYNSESNWFDEVPNYQLRGATSHIN